ncbi:hypothetical protein NPIL_7891 [Nephila pilipes]|uniref:Uncharacterized protein n=1 Tax=Nephila pilipes TaxID=299642 RepID=A0A8X6TR93_NEPPI|nr:hypothetical protein NPIL_7891 [Nephila pilipes]
MSAASNSKDEDNDDKSANTQVVHLKETKTSSNHGDGRKMYSRKLNELLGTYVFMFLQLSGCQKYGWSRNRSSFDLLYLAGVYRGNRVTLEELWRTDRMQ